jgi:hypothetical protein
MGVFEKISKAIGLGKEGDVEDYMSTIEMEDVDVLHQAADFYVKPISLETDADVGTVMNELKARNIVLLNISPMVRQTAKLKSAIDGIRTFIVKINGDIARIDEHRILLTPTKVKIVKSRKK